MQKCREPQSTAMLGGPSECWADRKWPSANAGGAHAEGARTRHENAQSQLLAQSGLFSLLAAKSSRCRRERHVTRNHLSTSQRAVVALALPRCRTQGKESQAYTRGAASTADSLTRHLRKKQCRRAQPRYKQAQTLSHEHGPTQSAPT